MDLELVRTVVSAIAAVGTLGALALSIATLRSQLAQRRQEQAARISLQISDAPLSAIVHNASELPIFHVVAIAGRDGFQTHLSKQGAEILRPGESVSLTVDEQFERIMDATAALGSPFLVHRGSIELEKALRAATRMAEDEQRRSKLYMPSVVFTDGQGIRWKRSSTGELQATQATPPRRWRRVVWWPKNRR